ncbi:MAG: thioredoxin family protein [Candidatus Hydrogenedentes bacterium]|nr:thioredoxin family protein [Candidatus Hydrogenedentota bacterium]
MLIKALAIVLAGAAFGALIGSTRSCKDGACPLTANPKRGALWGGFLGLMVAFSVGALGPAAMPGVAVEDDGAAASSALTPVTSEEDFNREVAGNEGLSVVYFHANWCVACRRFKPTLEAVAREYGSQAKFVSVNTDQLRALSQSYRVKYLPTTIVFRNGAEVARLVGIASRDHLIDALT